MAGLIRRGLRGEGIAADVATKGEDALWMAEATEYDAIVLDVMLPGIDGFEVCRRLRDAGRLGADPDADRARRGPRPGRRARRRRRRLPDQAVLLRRAARPAAGAGPARARSSARPSSRSATCASTRPRGGSGAATTEIELSAKEFALLETFMRRPGRGALALRAARARLGLRLREPLQRRRLLRPLPAAKDRPAVRRPTRSRPCAAPATGCARTARREPPPDPAAGDARLRRVVMAVVLARVGLFLYLRLEPQLDESIDHGLRSRATEVAALVQRVGRPRRNCRAPSRWSSRTRASPRSSRPTGTVLDSTPQLGRAGARRRAELAARRGRDRSSSTRATSPGVEGEVRLLAAPVQARTATAPGRRRRLLARRPRRGAQQTSRSCCSIGGPVALLLASLAGYVASGAALRPVEAMRRRAAEISGARAGRAAAGPGGRRRAPPARRDAERDARPARGGARARAALRRRRQPRAAHAARPAQDRARARAALRAASAERAARRDRLGDRGDRPPDPARRGPAGGRPLGGGRACDRAASRSTSTSCWRRSATRFERPRRGAEPEARWCRLRAPASIVDVDRLRIEQALDQPGRQRAAPRRRRRSRSRRAPRTARSSSTSRDAGPGFPRRASRPRAFERFSRADAGRAGGGTGLGLAIVETIARAHGGSAPDAANRPAAAPTSGSSSRPPD